VKIVYLNSSGQIGGAEGVLLDLLAGLRRSEPAWRLHLIAPVEGPLTERALSLGAGVTVSPFAGALARLGDSPAGRRRRPAALAARLVTAAAAAATHIRRLRRLLRALAPDLIHSNGLKTHVLAAWAARAPVVWHFHDYVSGRPLAARLLRLSARGCAMAVANSASVAADVGGQFGRRLGVRQVHNAVNLERFSPEGERADLDALAGLPPAPAGVVRIGLVATFARWKGHDTFMRALARLPADLPVRAYVIGAALYQTEGSQYGIKELRRMAEGAGVADRVGFTGHAARPEEALRALDVVVHASTAPEPFGLVIAEAMACGRAVVASAAGGAAELFTPGRDALAHRPGDDRGLADCLARLAYDPALRAALGEAARKTAVARFDSARMIAEWLPIYRDLAARGGGAGGGGRR